ncbi:hypothetical protein A3A84_02875 [Candidatus Collierbacteria bacterium RIFCSPLOWO2_01_FULL_50_23]|uniref:Uncharacterized protein n=2 Tax=Candidatus Collieribacteriota TaxID=1752725 RepID=A0A1F5EWF7_9BACT|nr:MAG: hypothetical protein A2703_01130 [Candidatus Collierbacteria bacterium RIFCSPHIGHO2_01_FULL_50_25]OGD71717.1 MAG: hypothetical protein A3D09_04025 [Candidatus Collierbacteria bacterium RIFCSPHIGHO2_02_FULL_49_10]OGD75010.1 MAG: hypothetical protein A3A84_02875 [Candidatus Collierbacteria bacterium RIFCSPLOWO2_01_FULL_50_23]
MSARVENSIARLPITDFGCVEKTAKVLKKNIHFKWRGSAEWAGLTKADLVELTVGIATFIGITQEQAKKITITFGDHYKLPDVDTTYSAVCIPYHPDGVYTKMVVILNRSHEVALEVIARFKANLEEERAKMDLLGLYDPKPDDESYSCQLTPFESVVWSIAEELNHAHTMLIAGTIMRSHAWSKRYVEMLKVRGIQIKDDYETDLDEVAANRRVLRILAYLSPDEDKKQLFRQCYLRSLQDRRVFFAEITNTALIPTGYKPQ